LQQEKSGDRNGSLLIRIYHVCPDQSVAVFRMSLAAMEIEAED